MVEIASFYFIERVSLWSKKRGQTDYQGLHILAVDEIAIRKGHRYLTVVLDLQKWRRFLGRK